MTYEEAIKQLKSINNFDSLCQESHEALNIAIKVLEQYSEKPLPNKVVDDFVNEWDIQGWYEND